MITVGEVPKQRIFAVSEREVAKQLRRARMDRKARARRRTILRALTGIRRLTGVTCG
jgi:hypothetical protein